MREYEVANHKQILSFVMKPGVVLHFEISKLPFRSLNCVCALRTQSPLLTSKQTFPVNLTEPLNKYTTKQMNGYLTVTKAFLCSRASGSVLHHALFYAWQTMCIKMQEVLGCVILMFMKVHVLLSVVI